jgi:YfiH family protein
VIERRLGPARAIWTDRHGGVSEAPYDSLNLTPSVGDDPAAVAENRRRLAERTGLGPPDGWWWLRQVHGRDVVVAGGAPRHRPTADAAVTSVAALPLVVLTADCAPIALACDDAVAVVHAGWPGLLVGVIETAVTRLRGTGEGHVRAALGPCVHPEHYEFGRADLERMVARLGPSVESVTSTGAPALDIPAAVGAALARVGVHELDDVGVCTAASPDYFSYRRDGPTGRQALVVELEA